MRTRRALVIAGALGVAVIASGCTRGGSSGSPATSSAAPSASVSSSTVATTTRPGSASSTSTTTTLPAGPTIESLMLKVAPSGFTLQPDDVADTGPTNLKKAAYDDVLSSNARAVLVADGFIRGYQRQWANDTGSATVQNFVYLYEFATPEGAQAYVEHWRSTILAGDTGVTPQPFTPLGVPGGIGLGGRDQSGSAGVVLFAKGRYAVRALTAAGPKVDQAFPSSALALAQYQLLP